MVKYKAKLILNYPLPPINFTSFKDLYNKLCDMDFITNDFIDPVQNEILKRNNFDFNKYLAYLWEHENNLNFNSFENFCKIYNLKNDFSELDYYYTIINNLDCEIIILKSEKENIIFI